MVGIGSGDQRIDHLGQTRREMTPRIRRNPQFRMGRRPIFFIGQKQLFIKLFAGTQIWCTRSQFSTDFKARETDEVFGQLRDANRLPHIQHKHFAPVPNAAA